MDCSYLIFSVLLIQLDNVVFSQFLSLFETEPAMDDLILSVFGDESIFLSCNAGECLHYTMVPGFEVRLKHLLK